MVESLQIEEKEENMEILIVIKVKKNAFGFPIEDTYTNVNMTPADHIPFVLYSDTSTTGCDRCLIPVVVLVLGRGNVTVHRT